MCVQAFEENPFFRYPQAFYPNIYKVSSIGIKIALAPQKIPGYDRIFFSTNFYYHYNKAYVSYLGFFPQARSSSLFVEYGLYFLQHSKCRALYGQGRAFSLTGELGNEVGIKMLNSHYFGSVQITGKSLDMTEFTVVGIDAGRRNTGFIRAVGVLIKEGIENFRVTCLGMGNIDIPDQLKRKFSFLGR